MTHLFHEPFPYGAVPVSQAVRAQYAASHLSQRYPLPDALPQHHPLLLALEGTTPVQDALPAWWREAVDLVDPRWQPLLHTVSIDEFREGHIEEQRWRAFSLHHPDAELPHSPKIAPLLPGGLWRARFEGRGPKETPRDLDLVISTRPEYLLNMASGMGWKNCQSHDGTARHHLPGNLYDTSVAVAMLVPRGADIWAGSQITAGGVVLARTTLRLFEIKGTPTVLFGCLYDNNATLRFALLTYLIARCEQMGLSWGIGHWSLFSMVRCGYLGLGYHDRLQDDATTFLAEPFWLPDDWCLPYIDGEHTWHLQQSGQHRLAAVGHLATPLSQQEEVEHV